MPLRSLKVRNDLVIYVFLLNFIVRKPKSRYVLFKKIIL